MPSAIGPATQSNDRPYYSGKAKAHAVNVQVIADPAGRLIWASPALPGLTCRWRRRRARVSLAALAGAGVTAYADSAYHGAGSTIRAPFR